ncbi:MAG: DUF3489 domain-containing protein, partial [Reyranellaceae bacterium]
PMTKLSDSQLVILSAACQRADRLVLPLPDRLKGGAAQKVVASLMAKKLIDEVDAKRGEPVWRETGDGHGVTLVATDAAFAAIGIDPDEAPKTSRSPRKQPRKAASAPRTRADTKQAQLITMLQRPEGATVAEIAGALGWQHHTVRGAIAGALKKKLGLDVESEKVDERGRVYRIAA